MTTPERIKPRAQSKAIQEFLEYCHTRSYPAKTAIIHAGDEPDTLYYIVEGSVEVVLENEEGDDIVLAYLNAGSFFGEVGLFRGQKERSAWVRTRISSQIGEIGYKRFRQVSAEHPSLMFELASQMADRIANSAKKMSDLAFVDVSGRIAHTLMDLCKQPEAMTHPDGMQIKVSRQELARLVNCSREMAGRVLRNLEEEQLVSVKGKTIVVFGVGRSEEPRK
jgi:CRP/FNR family transcriptional regulator, cyclic AMP receptor protein